MYCNTSTTWYTFSLHGSVLLRTRYHIAAVTWLRTIITEHIQPHCSMQCTMITEYDVLHGETVQWWPQSRQHDAFTTYNRSIKPYNVFSVITQCFNLFITFLNNCGCFDFLLSGNFCLVYAACEDLRVYLVRVILVYKDCCGSISSLVYALQMQAKMLAKGYPSQVK
jgi:hypothetical protein